MPGINNAHQQTSLTPTPIVVVIKENESSLSRGIGAAMGPIALGAGCLGAGAGFLIGAIEGSPWIGAIIGGTLTAGTCGLLTRGIQVVGDGVADVAIYAVKLPFRITYGAVNGTCNVISATYQYVIGNRGSAYSSQEALARDAKMA